MKMLIYLLCLFIFSRFVFGSQDNQHHQSSPHSRLSSISLGFLVSEVARDGRSVVAVAYGDYLPISLNEHSVSKGFARAECCAYKAAVTECGV